MILWFGLKVVGLSRSELWHMPLWEFVALQDAQIRINEERERQWREQARNG